MAEPSLKAQGWVLFDQIVAEAPSRASNPWRFEANGSVRFAPDFDTLERLLGVPVFLGATSQSGVPALALDVWVAYELRRAGLEEDAVWPRPREPRVLPSEVASLVDSLPQKLQAEVNAWLERGTIKGVTSASANLLGKNYVKQVDVVMSRWQTGPELMISTKRMDSSFGKNAANRVEESYGDAKNLRLRYPQAALGFLYSLRSTAYQEAPEVADWIMDLLVKLGREDDAYDAVCLLVPEWSGKLPVDDDLGQAEDAAPMEIGDISADADKALADPPFWLNRNVDRVPRVPLRHSLVPPGLDPGRFFAVMIDRVLEGSPINFHRQARERQRNPRGSEDTS